MSSGVNTFLSAKQVTGLINNILQIEKQIGQRQMNQSTQSDYTGEVYNNLCTYTFRRQFGNSMFHVQDAASTYGLHHKSPARPGAL